MPSHTLLIGCGLLSALLCQSTMAQEEPWDESVPATGFFYTVASVDEVPDAIPYSIGDDPMALVNWPQISDELEIVDEQRAQIQALHKEMQKQMERTMQDVMKRQQEGQTIDHRQIGERMKQLNQNLRERLNKEVLLPHQSDRLKQLALQMKMRNQGGSALMNERIAKELGISEGQRERLKRAAKEAQQHVRTEMVRLREEAKERVMSELTDAQREKLKAMLGNPVDLSLPQPGGARQ